MDEINLRQKEDRDKNRAEMVTILKRLNEETSSPESLEVDDGVWDELQRKLEDGESIELEDLPKELQKQFLDDISTSNVSEYIKEWKPWWLMPENLHNATVGNLIQVVEEKEGKTENGKMGLKSASSLSTSSTVPCIRTYLQTKQFQDAVLPTQVSTCLPYHCMQVVFYYCLQMRLYNGDVEDLENEIVEGILSMSSVLSKSVAIPSVEHLVAHIRNNEELLELAQSTHQESANKQFFFQEYILRGLYDVSAIFEIPHFAIDALAHCSIMFDSVYRRQRQKRIILAQKKLVFYTTYLRKCTAEEFWLLQKEVGKLKSMIEIKH